MRTVSKRTAQITFMRNFLQVVFGSSELIFRALNLRSLGMDAFQPLDVQTYCDEYIRYAAESMCSLKFYDGLVSVFLIQNLAPKNEQFVSLYSCYRRVYSAISRRTGIAVQQTWFQSKYQYRIYVVCYANFIAHQPKNEQ